MQLYKLTDLAESLDFLLDIPEPEPTPTSAVPIFYREVVRYATCAHCGEVMGDNAPIINNYKLYHPACLKNLDTVPTEFTFHNPKLCVQCGRHVYERAFFDYDTKSCHTCLLQGQREALAATKRSLADTAKARTVAEHQLHKADIYAKDLEARLNEATRRLPTETKQQQLKEIHDRLTDIYCDLGEIKGKLLK